MCTVQGQKTVHDPHDLVGGESEGQTDRESLSVCGCVRVKEGERRGISGVRARTALQPSRDGSRAAASNSAAQMAELLSLPPSPCLLTLTLQISPGFFVFERGP